MLCKKSSQQLCQLIVQSNPKQKKGKLLKSQCSTLYPCCVPALGEFEGSYLSKTCPRQRYNSVRMRPVFIFGNFVKVSHKKSLIKFDKGLISLFYKKRLALE